MWEKSSTKRGYKRWSDKKAGLVEHLRWFVFRAESVQKHTSIILRVFRVISSRILANIGYTQQYTAYTSYPMSRSTFADTHAFLRRDRLHLLTAEVYARYAHQNQQPRAIRQSSHSRYKYAQAYLLYTKLRWTIYEIVFLS